MKSTTTVGRHMSSIISTVAFDGNVAERDLSATAEI